jgi:hypothetical protein
MSPSAPRNDERTTELSLRAKRSNLMISCENDYKQSKVA